METDKARAAVNAQASLDHPLLDFRTPEARARTDWMPRHLAPYVEAGRRLLDVGCSSGKHSFRAAEMGLRVTGIDCADAMLERARALAEEASVEVEFVLGDYTEMPFPDGTFDYALFPKNIVECTYAEYRGLVDELARVMTKDGKLFLSMVDWIDRIVGSGANSNYNRMTGGYETTIAIPGHGVFEYPTTFWTIGFARFLTEASFDLIESWVIDDRPTILMVFDRSSRPT